jgi:hypothetical protein
MADSDPQRDRRAAAVPRQAPRRVAALHDELERLRASPEYAAMRRFARIHGALDAALPPAARGKVRAVGMRQGVVALEVVDGVLLAELRTTCARRLLESLIAARTGASRLVWRVARRG